MSEGREKTLWFVVEPPGAIATTNREGHALIRDAARGRGRGRATTKHLFGLDWEALRTLASRAEPAIAKGGLRVTAEPMFDADGSVASMLVQAEAVGADGKALGRPALERGFARIGGEDPSVRASLTLAESFAKTALPILIVAEDGAGARDLVDGIVAKSPLSGEPLVCLDAATIVGPLGELVALAPLAGARGTLFVESVEDLGLDSQRELCEALDAGFLKEVHLVCSARSDLRPLVEASTFRRDLYQLLRGAAVTLPPLRDRSDKASLADRLLSYVAPAAVLSSRTRAVIDRHAFPGNLPELEAALGHAAALAGDERVLEPHHLPPEMLADRESSITIPGTKTTAERSALAEAVRFAGGNMSRAAKRLGVARSTLYRMMERHGLRET